LVRLAALVAATVVTGALPARAATDAPAATDGAGAKKKAHKSAGKKAPKSKTGPDTKTAGARSQKSARQKSAETINESVTLTPFPSHAGAAKKALAQNRRDQLEDAEKAARDPGQADRWQTVLFHLRNLDARSDAEGCFWRLVAYYRLGQVDRARTLRNGCDLGPKDAAIIDAEEAQAARLQPSGPLAEGAVGVANGDAYVGAGPAHIDR
jgi:hypothetical protein